MGVANATPRSDNTKSIADSFHIHLRNQRNLRETKIFQFIFKIQLVLFS